MVFVGVHFSHAKTSGDPSPLATPPLWRPLPSGVPSPRASPPLGESEDSHLGFRMRKFKL